MPCKRGPPCPPYHSGPAGVFASTKRRRFGTRSTNGGTSMKLQGQVALITGGGRGIGREIALRYASEGAAISISGTTETALQSVARELIDKGARSLATTADVADESAVERLVSRTIAELGRIDILV